MFQVTAAEQQAHEALFLELEQQAQAMDLELQTMAQDMSDDLDRMVELFDADQGLEIMQFISENGITIVEPHEVEEDIFYYFMNPDHYSLAMVKQIIADKKEEEAIRNREQAAAQAVEAQRQAIRDLIEEWEAKEIKENKNKVRTHYDELGHACYDTIENCNLRRKRNTLQRLRIQLAEIKG